MAMRVLAILMIAGWQVGVSQDVISKDLQSDQSELHVDNFAMEDADATHSDELLEDVEDDEDDEEAYDADADVAEFLQGEDIVQGMHEDAAMYDDAQDYNADAEGDLHSEQGDVLDLLSEEEQEDQDVEEGFHSEEYTVEDDSDTGRGDEVCETKGGVKITGKGGKAKCERNGDMVCEKKWTTTRCVSRCDHTSVDRCIDDKGNKKRRLKQCRKFCKGCECSKAVNPPSPAGKEETKSPTAKPTRAPTKEETKTKQEEEAGKPKPKEVAATPAPTAQAVRAIFKLVGLGSCRDAADKIPVHYVKVCLANKCTSCYKLSANSPCKGCCHSIYCEEACSADSACQAFEYDRAQKKCTLYTKVHPLGEDPGWVRNPGTQDGKTAAITMANNVGEVIVKKFSFGTATWWSPGCKVKMEAAASWVGHCRDDADKSPPHYQNVTSRRGCAAQCVRDSSCKAYEFDCKKGCTPGTGKPSGTCGVFTTPRAVPQGTIAPPGWTSIAGDGKSITKGDGTGSALCRASPVKASYITFPPAIHKCPDGQKIKSYAVEESNCRSAVQEVLRNTGKLPATPIPVTAGSWIGTGGEPEAPFGCSYLRSTTGHYKAYYNRNKNGKEEKSRYSIVCTRLYEATHIYVGKGACRDAAGKYTNHYPLTGVTKEACEAQCNKDIKCKNYDFSEGTTKSDNKCDIYTPMAPEQRQKPSGWEQGNGATHITQANGAAGTTCMEKPEDSYWTMSMGECQDAASVDHYSKTGNSKTMKELCQETCKKDSGCVAWEWKQRYSGTWKPIGMNCRVFTLALKNAPAGWTKVVGTGGKSITGGDGKSISRFTRVNCYVKSQVYFHAPEGSDKCPDGTVTVEESKCRYAVLKVLLTPNSRRRAPKPNNPQGSDHEKLETGSWPKVPVGCSYKKGKDGKGTYAPYFNSKTGGKNDGEYVLVCISSALLKAQASLDEAKATKSLLAGTPSFTTSDDHEEISKVDALQERSRTQTVMRKHSQRKEVSLAVDVRGEVSLASEQDNDPMEDSDQ